jgi:prophage regulatory protein
MMLAPMFDLTSSLRLSPSIYTEKSKEKSTRILAGWPDKCFGQGRSIAATKGLAMSLPVTATAALPIPDDDLLLRVPEVMRRLGVSETTLYRLIRAGRFPKPLRPSPNLNAWRASDVRKHIAGLGS